MSAPGRRAFCSLPWRRWTLLDDRDGIGGSYLDETNVGGLLAEALTADVEAVLADQTSGVGADAAVEVMSASVASHIPSSCAFVFSPSTAHCCLARPHATHAMPETSPHRYRKDV